MARTYRPLSRPFHLLSIDLDTGKIQRYLCMQTAAGLRVRAIPLQHYQVAEGDPRELSWNPTILERIRATAGE